MAFRWNEPGRNPYTGPKAAAVMRLEEIPLDERRALADMVGQAYSGQVIAWTRDGDRDGRFVNLRDMNFGADGLIVPGAVDTSGWAPGHTEGARVFCAGYHCVAWFARCGNIARVDDSKLPAPALSAREAHAARLAGGTGLRLPGGGAGGGARAVPEPAGWALGLLAVVLAVRMRGPRR